MSENVKRTIQEAAAETRLLEARLSLVAAGGDQVAYVDLNAAGHCNVQKEGRGYLTTARRMVRRDKGAVFRCIRGVGLERVRPEDAHTIGESARTTIHNKARETVKNLVAATDGAEMDNDARLKTNTQLALMGAMALLTTRERVKRLAAAVVGNNYAALAADHALDAVRNGDKG